MRNQEDIRRGRRVFYSLQVHLVFVTKFRRDVLTDAMLQRCEESMGNVCVDFDTELLTFNGEDDHVHLLVSYPPKVALSRLVNSLKGVSSRRLRADFPALQHRVHQGRLWSPSYFAASTGGATLDTLKQYLDSQRIIL